MSVSLSLRLTDLFFLPPHVNHGAVGLDRREIAKDRDESIQKPPPVRKPPPPAAAESAATAEAATASTTAESARKQAAAKVPRGPRSAELLFPVDAIPYIAARRSPTHQHGQQRGKIEATRKGGIAGVIATAPVLPAQVFEFLVGLLVLSLLGLQGIDFRFDFFLFLLQLADAADDHIIVGFGCHLGLHIKICQRIIFDFGDLQFDGLPGYVVRAGRELGTLLQKGCMFGFFCFDAPLDVVQRFLQFRESVPVLKHRFVV
jgi:hypothetical protein